MSVSYNKLWKLLIDKKMKKKELSQAAGISNSLIAKLGKHEAEIEKIKSIFLSILRDIKKDIDSGKQPEKTATAAMLQGVQDEIRERSQEHLSKDDVADIVVNQFGLASKMNEKSISLFKRLMKGMMK